MSITKQSAAGAIACFYSATVLWLEWRLGEVTYAWSHPNAYMFYNLAPLVPTIGLAVVVRKAKGWISIAAFYLLLISVALGAARIAYFAQATEDEWVLLGLLVIAAWETGALLLLLIGWSISVRMNSGKGSA